MNELNLNDVDVLRKNLGAGNDLISAFVSAIGDKETCDGMWRFYSGEWPKDGLLAWNQSSSWKDHWNAFLPKKMFCFGEDVFGNQLVMLPSHETVLLWNHENGELFDLYADLVTLISTVLESGIDWIDFYGDGSLDVARNYGAIPRESHLHWTNPLVLGGEVSGDNISLLERQSHLVGHAKLWAQICGLPPGTIVSPEE